jgi:hypothetical protein
MPLWSREAVYQLVNPNPSVNLVRALAGHNEELPFLAVEAR